MAVQVARLVSGVEVERNPEPAPVYLMCLWDQRLGVGGNVNVDICLYNLKRQE